MELPGLGVLKKDEQLDWYYTEEINMPLLNNFKIKFALSMLDDFIEYKDRYSQAIKNILHANDKCLKKVEKYIFQYYKDMEEYYLENGQNKKIKKNEIWENITWGLEPLVSFRPEDKTVYIVFECECTWEVEHGLQITFKNGEVINKIGSYDGHLTNSDAFNRPEFESKVYISRKDLGY